MIKTSGGFSILLDGKRREMRIGNKLGTQINNQRERNLQICQEEDQKTVGFNGAILITKFHYIDRNQDNVSKIAESAPSSYLAVVVVAAAPSNLRNRCIHLETWSPAVS